MEFKERIAIVTGSGQGIGAGIAKYLAENGAHVIITDINEENIKNMVKEITANGGKATGIKADVSKKDEAALLVEKAMKEHNKIDILVNNVGISRDARVLKMTEEQWDSVLNVNLKSYFLCSQAVAPVMISQKYGRIVNISSRAWLGGFGQSNYSAAKGGVISLTRTLAIELAKDGITANAIAPGIIDTPMFRSFSQDAQERLMKMQPIGNIGKPKDIAYAVAFFASEKAAYITGQTLHVCGGKSLGAYW